VTGSLILDPRPSLTSIDNLSEKSPHQNTKESKEETFDGSERQKSRSISMFADDPYKRKLGWPLLRKSNSDISQSHHGRGISVSVVQWVMSLPDRSPRSSPQSSSSDENPFERSISDLLEDESFKNHLPPSVVLPKGLEGILNVNSLNCKWLSLEALKSCTSQFSSGRNCDS
jgi:hypothetical protein